jgi:hypothetical protein
MVLTAQNYECAQYKCVPCVMMLIFKQTYMKTGKMHVTWQIMMLFGVLAIYSSLAAYDKVYKRLPKPDEHVE